MDKIIEKEIRDRIREELDLLRELEDYEIEDIIDKIILLKSRNTYINLDDKVLLANKIFDSLRRLDVIQPLIEDEEITEIMVNGKDNIFIEKKGEIYKTNVKFESTEKLEDVIQNIVSKVNRVVNESSPICDARLGDGSRISVVLPPIALNGPILTIRKFSKKPITIDNLIGWNTLTKEAADFLQEVIKARYNLFISGGTGSGKTTLLNILSNYIPQDERIITIEDSAELQINNVLNVVSLETRNSNIEGKGRISIRDLIRTSLRMRPDRIVIGEVRGEEALDMLQAMNTGHDGSLSTGHSNSIKDMLSRLETMILSKESFPLEAIRKQIASSIDIMIHLGRLQDKSRRVLEISEIIGFENKEILINPLFTYNEDNNIKGLKATGNRLINIHKLNQYGDKGE